MWKFCGNVQAIYPKLSLPEKCPKKECFWPALSAITEQIFVFSPNTGKYGPEKTQHLNTFHTVSAETVRFYKFSIPRNYMNYGILCIDILWFIHKSAIHKSYVHKSIHKSTLPYTNITIFFSIFYFNSGTSWITQPNWFYFLHYIETNLSICITMKIN